MEEKILLTKQTMVDIAEAVREKTNKKTQLMAEDIPQAILDIKTGSGVLKIFGMPNSEIIVKPTIEISGIESSITVEIIPPADHSISTVSTGNYDASVSIDGITYLYSNVTNNPVTIGDGSLQLTYGNPSQSWQLIALKPMTAYSNGKSYNTNDIINTWKYNTSYTDQFYLV